MASCILRAQECPEKRSSFQWETGFPLPKRTLSGNKQHLGRLFFVPLKNSPTLSHSFIRAVSFAAKHITGQVYTVPFDSA